MKKIVLYHQVTAALLAALLAVMSPFSLSLGSVPLSLATFAVYLCALLAGGGWGTVSVVIYLLLGAIGVPVFSGFVGGIQTFAGPTGGFLIGYIPCVAVAGLLIRKSGHRPLLWGLSLLLGTVILYLFGSIWYAASTDTPFFAALTVSVLPFIPADIIKLVAATSLAYPVRKTLEKTA